MRGGSRRRDYRLFIPFLLLPLLLLLCVHPAVADSSTTVSGYYPGTIPAPVADFIAEPLTGPVPLQVSFTDLSQNSPAEWAWDFENDGTIDSTDQNPVTVFDTPGTYSVRLTVRNPSGSDSCLRLDYITVYPLETGRISIQSHPPQARVLLDGVEKGYTPLTLQNVAVGEHQVLLEKPGYAQWEGTIFVQAKKTAHIFARLESNTGTIMIWSYPSKAQVILDGIEVGYTPLIIREVGTGEHHLVLEKSGYIAWEETITVEAGRTFYFFPRLGTMTGTIVIWSFPSHAIVRLDSDNRGYTPLTIREVPAGEHLVVLEMTGYKNWEKTVSLGPGETEFVLGFLKR